MPAPACVPLAEMQSLLQGVARSFYLSIRLLPAPLRHPVALGYLLARAADTLADTPGRPVADRLEDLQVLAAAIDGDMDARRRLGVRLAGPSTGAATAEELRLLQRLPACLEALDTVEPADRQDLRTVLRHITHGQSLDLQRFADPGEVAALPDAAALDQYTYLVAGCVGEFWTTQCLRHVPDFAALPADTMRALGREYGMGLQLVNILRDCGQDLAQGRCYLPADELAAEGLGPAQAQAAPVALRPVWDRWHARALGRIDAGLRYAQAVHSARIRAAGVLPALLGVRTLALLQAAGPAAFTRRVKVPRAEVRWILGRLVFTLARPGLLAGQYLRLREQPVNGWDNPRR